MIAVRTCRDCIHHRNNKPGAKGYCTRNPPATIPLPNGHLGAAFPPVEPDWRCGEFKKKEG